MQPSRNIFLRQKLGKVQPKSYTTYLPKISKVVKVLETVYVTDRDGNEFSHFINEKNEGWENYLKVGNNVAVYVIEREKNGKTYKNIYPNHFTNPLIPDEDID